MFAICLVQPITSSWFQFNHLCTMFVWVRSITIWKNCTGLMNLKLILFLSFFIPLFSLKHWLHRQALIINIPTSMFDVSCSVVGMKTFCCLPVIGSNIWLGLKFLRVEQVLKRHWHFRGLYLFKGDFLHFVFVPDFVMNSQWILTQELFWSCVVTKKINICMQNVQRSTKLYCYSLRCSVITQINTCIDDSLWIFSLTFWTWCSLLVCTRAPPLPVHSVFCTSRTKCAGWRGDSTQPKSSWCLSAVGVRRTAQLTYQSTR